MRSWLIIPLLAVALAGCSDAAEAPETMSGPAAATDDAGNQTASPAPAASDGQENATEENTPPTALLDASVVNGTAPLNVTFTLNGTDADGDDLSWQFAIGDIVESGAELPATIQHTFDVGNHTAVLTVTDRQATAEVNITIHVEAAPVREVERPDPIVFTGTVTVPDPFALSDQCIMPLADFAGTGAWGGVHDLPADIGAWTFTVDGGAVAMFITSDGSSIGGSGSSGRVGDGMDQALVCAASPMVDYTLTISPP